MGMCVAKSGLMILVNVVPKEGCSRLMDNGDYFSQHSNLGSLATFSGQCVKMTKAVGPVFAALDSYIWMCAL